MTERIETSGGIKWVAAAVLAVVAAGCASRQPPPPAAQPVAVRPTTPTDDLDQIPATAPPPPAPTVNVFGELNGQARGAARPIGDEGFQQQTFADEGYDADVAVDPAGKLMCFASTRHGERSALYLQRTDGTAVTRLTSDDSDNAFPSFSPDGTRLVYSSLGGRSRQWELWVVTLATGEKRQVSYGLFPTWSPNRDVDRIAFQRARERGSRWFSLWTLDLSNGEAHRTTEVAVSSNAAVVSPTWSPDGQRLAFATVLDPSKHAARTARGEQDVWTIAADGTDRRRLTDGNGVNLSPCWSNDGRVYFVSNRGGTENVWSVRPEAGQTYTAARPTRTINPTARPGETPPVPDSIGSADTRDADR